MTNKVQYFHERLENKNGEMSCYGGFTYCLEVPTSKELVDLAKSYLENLENNGVTLKLGVARCHETDRYVRKEGNKISFENLSGREFKIDKVAVDGEDALFVLTNGGYTIWLKAYLEDQSFNSRFKYISRI